ncbi:2987_t:CDS:2 [Acaulospora morrowiae]|uniref:2987_t:CDS:1 n=1 Tax=Acaulospora morrowiae TaxID=94023 RepID=A0A9N9C9Y7_9GLOM|nr:2987_t:CDS:2 [Acaulospora morrowiae]
MVNADIFEDKFQNDFSILIERFKISRKNPIKVILPYNKRDDEIKGLTAGVAEITLQDRIWIYFGQTRPVSLRQDDFEGKVRCVDDLKRVVKERLKSSLGDITEELITLRKGEIELEDNILVTELYNTKNEALEVVVKRNDDQSPHGKMVTESKKKIFDKIQSNEYGNLLSASIHVIHQRINTHKWDASKFWDIQIKDKHEQDCLSFWDEIFKLLSQKEHLSNNRNENFIKELFPNREISVICCIDEAHELLEKTLKKQTHSENYFIQWRRQIRQIKWRGFFNILLSTNGKIDNYLPPVIKDTHSARLHQFYLFPAFLDVHNMDILMEFAQPGDDYDPKRNLYLGIPLWGSLAQAGVILSDILHLACQKICNFSKKQDRDRLANLACMACSVAIEISPRIADVDTLIASYMATAIGVSQDRAELLCTYPSDPILSSGALKGIVDVGWEDCLDTLIDLFSRGVVEAGERGELVNRILFLEAYMRVVEKGHEAVTYLEKVAMSSFLNALCREIHQLNEAFEKMGIKNAEIGFNHWISLQATNQDHVKEGGRKFLSEELIIEAYHRHAAFKMPSGFPVIDHIIPFKHSNGYGILSIQYKNSKISSFNQTNALGLINPISAFGSNLFNGEILGIYIDLGVNEAEASLVNIKSITTRQNKSTSNQIIYIKGIESFVCNEKIGKRLSKLLYTRPWPLDDQWSMLDNERTLDRKNAIKSYFPIVFERPLSIVKKWKLK